MSWNLRDLPEDRPSSFDEVGKRLFLYPADVKGRYRTRRNYVFLALTLLFLVLPWTTFNGEQTILLSLVERRFVFFGYTFWAHDGPLIFFPLMLAVLGICLATSIWGRIWCGWACPQTVFIDGVFRRIEALIEGNHIKRRKLDDGPWTGSKIIKKTLKWSLFFVVSSHIAHSFTAYFVGAQNLVWITLASPLESWSLFLFVQAFTLVLLFDFGWFREQFCMIMCPYGRFQSVLMGRNSLAVVYDEKRGEPRRGQTKEGEKRGDCVNCYRCVQVCPTGIDIRKGVQMECIACTACIDACDEIMKNVKQPPGLIRYASETEIQGQKRQLFTKRSMTYMAAIFLALISFAIILSHRTGLQAQVVRAIESPYTVVNETVINHFRLKLKGDSRSELKILSLNTNEGEIVAPQLPLRLKPGAKQELHFFVKRSQLALEGQSKLPFTVELLFQNDSGVEQKQAFPLSFLAPEG